MSARAACVTAGLLLVTASAALGATGTARFTVQPPRDAGTQAAHVEFWLPAGYAQLIGALGGNPAIGAFRRQVRTGGRRSCTDDLEAVGRAQHTPPARNGNRVRIIKGDEPGPGSRSKYLRILRSGHTGRVQWYVGPTWSWPRTSPNPRYTDYTALGVMRAPARFASKLRPWAVVTVDLHSSCSKGEATLVRELVRAIREMRLVAGKATAAPGVPTATA